MRKDCRHALIDPSTGLVRNIILWEGAPWLPPKDHYVVHDCDGQMGDYWDQEKKCFYTPSGKRRYRNEEGKIGEVELNQDEQTNVLPKLERVYMNAVKKFKFRPTPDWTLGDENIPALVMKAAKILEEDNKLRSDDAK